MSASSSRAVLLERLLREKGIAVGTDQRIPRRSGAGPARLSFAQERLWFLDRLEPGRVAYNVPTALRLSGPLRPAVLRRALSKVVARHEVLRTTYGERDGVAIQVVGPPASLALPRIDLSALSKERRSDELHRLAADEAGRPFGLRNGPVLRARLVRLAPASHALLVTVHHIAFDGWSAGVTTREVGALYAALAAGRPSPLPELPIQYADYATWQREWLSGAELERQTTWWRRQLEGLPPLLELPADRPRPARRSGRGAARPVRLEPTLTSGVRHLAAHTGATPFMVLLAAFGAVLARHSGKWDFAVGTPVAGRRRVETEGLIGFFVNTLVLRQRPRPADGFGAYLGDVRELFLEAQNHQDLPFERLVEELHPERSMSHTPLFQVMFTLQGAVDGVAGGRSGGDGASDEPAGRLRMAPLAGAAGATEKFDLTLVLVDDGERFGGTLSYATDLFDGTTMERLARHLRTLLGSALASPETPLSALPMLSPAQRRQVTVELNDSGAAYPRQCSIPELFATVATERPQADAVVFPHRRLTYGELDGVSTALAWHLRAAGVGRGTPVAVSGGRSAELVVAWLAILRAGGAYVPLDPDYPEERQRFMLRETAAPVLLTAPGGDTDAVAEVLVLEVDLEALAEEAALASPDPPVALGGDDLAYVVYTSGSTGRPKGVMVPHRGVVRLVRGSDFFQAAPGDRIAFASNVSFDAATVEVWGALLNGAALVGVGREEVLSPAALERRLGEEGVSFLFLTTALFHQAVQERPGAFDGLSTLMFGGEACDPSLVRRALAECRAGRLLHAYGPTETTTFATWYHVRRVAREARLVPVGRPVANSTAYVVDRRLWPQPVGVAGELVLGGDGLARGYLQRPALTAERFIPSPFGDGERLYRTGDRVRWNAGGELEFLGRFDHQVKLRGFRIELGEIESALVGTGRVVHAAVRLEEGAGGATLTAYVQPAPGVAAEGGELRAELGQRLPAPMVPSRFAVLESLPLTPNGKVDREALGRMEVAVGADDAVAPPRTPVEEILVAIWRRTLGVEQVSRESRFFDLGGHSLLATRVASRIRESLGVELPLRALFEAPRLADLAARVEAIRAAGEAAPPPLQPRPRQGPPPLSFAQERLWFIDRLEPESAAYNVPMALRLVGALEPSALRWAFTTVVARHEVLRTTYAERRGTAVQVVVAAEPLSVPWIDLSALPEGRRRGALRRLAAGEARRPFDLAAGPVLRVRLVRLAAREHALLVTVHHVAFDGWSMGVMTREVAALYGARVAGRRSPLEALPIQYADYAAWQREWLQGAELERQVVHWRRELAGLPPLLELPTDRPRPAVGSQRGAARSLSLPPELSSAVDAAALEHGATPFMVLLAGFGAVLSRWAGREDLAVGTPVAGRTRGETEELIGFFVNTLVLRQRPHGEASFSAHLARVRETALAAFAHQDLPFGKLVEELRPERSLAHAPLFQVMLALQSVSAGVGAGEAGGAPVERAGGLRMAPLPGGDGGTEKFDLTLTLSRQGDRYAGSLSYATDLFDETTVGRLARHLRTLLASALASPETPLSALPMLTAAEAQQLLTEWAGRSLPVDRETTLDRLVRAQAERTPEAEALVWQSDDGAARRLTYGELVAQAGVLSAQLRRRGAGVESRVGVCLRRRPELLVSLLAVLETGAAYVPLDPDYPAERVRFMVADSGARLVVCEPDLTERMTAPGVAVVEVGPALGEPEDEVPPASAPGVLAYVIYTSGSTGRPKGVAITHRSAVELVRWAWRTYGEGELSSVLASTSVCFDLSVFELFAPLAGGGRVVLVDDALALPRTGTEVSLVNTVPSAMGELVQGELPASLRVVNLAGEPLPPPLAAAVHGQGVPRVVNLYGPSEDTTYSTRWEVPRGSARMCIGRPLENSRAYVMDGGGRPVPAGVPGELYLGGAGLARGYLGRPSLTAERFVPDPYGDGGRLYRTGDSVRWRADGDLEFLGRLDHQVKLRGFRIELGEIETVLADLPTVEAVAVLVRSTGAGPALVAFVEGASVAPEELRNALAARLPAYMVPASLVLLDRLPLTPNGKIDRRALAALETDGGTSTPAAPPRDELELRLAMLFEELLGAGPVSPRDDFFSLGGHSLLAVRLFARLRDDLGVDLPVSTLFRDGTVAALARRVRSAGPRPTGPRVLLRGGGDAPPLHCLHPVGGQVVAYRDLAAALPAQRQVWGVAASGLPPSAGDDPLPRRAERYLEALGAPGPLLGWSLGGLLAFEMASRISPAVPLILLDAAAPAHFRELTDTDRAQRIVRFAHDLAATVGARADLDPGEVRRLLYGGEVWRELARRAHDAGVLATDLGAADLETLFATHDDHLRMAAGYRPAEPWPGRALLLRAAGTGWRRRGVAEEDLGWGDWIADLEVVEVPGDHYGVLRPPAVVEVAARIGRFLSR